MIETHMGLFACDECPIVEELEYRQTIAEQCGWFQHDHCACEKVGDEFFSSGYCSDAWAKAEKTAPHGKRKTGRAYRRKMERQKLKRNLWIAEHNYFAMRASDNGAYVTRQKHSKKEWKKYSNHVVRRYQAPLPKGNSHNKLFDYWWTIS